MATSRCFLGQYVTSTQYTLDLRVSPDAFFSSSVASRLLATHPAHALTCRAR